ncbi:hypothetical protein MP228_012836 [Amoeboaphelidium protococcarum]|nr:hypothetical protein MP228_012836 [Amoeboaphelidium protococcarum]
MTKEVKKTESAAVTGGNEQKKLKPCCACPETKKARDECVLLKGDDDVECKKFIEEHKKCMRSHGFNV